MKTFFCGLLILLSAAAPQPQAQPDEMMVGAANKKLQRTLAELQRESSAVHLRLIADIDKAQRNAEAKQEQARLDLAAKTALAMSRLGKGSQDKGPELRKAFTTELSQAREAFQARLAEIDGEHNQSIAQAVARFAQQKAEVLNNYPKDMVPTIQRLTEEMSAPDLPKTVAAFKVALPTFAHPADASETSLEDAYRADTEAARKAYLEARNEARTKVLATIQRSLEAAPEGATEEQAEEIKNTIKRLGLWAADSMDTYQIALKSALRKYQLGENRPQPQAKAQQGDKPSAASVTVR
jgi:hypothetical protein